MAGEIIHAWIWVKEEAWDRVRDLLNDDPDVLEVEFQDWQDL